jgi:hypothetical protein
MVIDHIGLFFFPDYLILRIIGRLSFPLFAFLIANGAHYTKNINKYIGRMFVFAVISQIPYYFASSLIDFRLSSLNVLFTFFLALTAILFLKKAENKSLIITFVISVAIAAQLLNTDYGMFGILLTVSLYLFFTNSKAKIISFLLLSLVFSLAPAIKLMGLNIFEIDFGPVISTFSLIFILSYNHKIGLKTKYLFYIFYPLQYVIFYLINNFSHSGT